MFSGRADDRRLVDKEAARPSLTIFHGGGGGIPLARAYRKALRAAEPGIDHYVAKNVPLMDHRIMLHPRNFLRLSRAGCRLLHLLTLQLDGKTGTITVWVVPT